MPGSLVGGHIRPTVKDPRCLPWQCATLSRPSDSPSASAGPLALNQLDLTVEAGEVFGFLGPNGAGKSTTIRLLLGHLRPTAGQAWIFGDASGDAAAAHRHLAYVPADVALWPALTGAETLELLADIGPGIDRRYRDELVQRFELEVDRRCGTYSTGNRQKVALVAAFAADGAAVDTR